MASTQALPARGSLLDRLGIGRREVPGAFRGARNELPSRKRVAVIGGGFAGIACATALAERGVQVVLYEKEDSLGGRVAGTHDRLPDGREISTDGGFIAFHRHYYNLRRLLRRIDPELSRLRPLPDYPLLERGGFRESFHELPKTAPLNLLSLLRRSSWLKLSDLRRIDAENFRALLNFDPLRHTAQWDDVSAADFLNQLGLPEHARRTMLRVLCHAVCHSESELSAAEMLSLFHYYFLGNPEGLAFDVLEEPAGDAIFSPFAKYLQTKGAELRFREAVLSVDRNRGDLVELHSEKGSEIFDGVVVATTVNGLQTLFHASPALTEDLDLARSISSLSTSSSYTVLRAYFDKPLRDDRDPFAWIDGFASLDTVALYDRFEGESRRFAVRTFGSVLQAQAYGIPEALSDQEVEKRMLSDLRSLYPELESAQLIHRSMKRLRSAPSFPMGTQKDRPRIATSFGNIAIAGDYVKVPFPCANIERAVSSGMLSANLLLDRWDVKGETLYSIPPRGFLSGMRSRILGI